MAMIAHNASVIRGTEHTQDTIDGMTLYPKMVALSAPATLVLN